MATTTITKTEKLVGKRIRRREAGVRRPRTMTRWRNMRGEIVTAPRER